MAENITLIDKEKDLPSTMGTEPVIRLGMGTCGLAAGAEQVRTTLENELSRRGILAKIVPVGCIGLCEAEVLAEVKKDGKWYMYGHLTGRDIPDLVQKWFFDDDMEDDHLLGRTVELENFGNQARFVLENCGRIDPDSLDDYIATGGYEALKKALEMNEEDLLKTIIDSGLRGRGGGGFPTGLKWKLCREAEGSTKYVVCNADEGDPGAFMDRSLIEGDPHRVLEGMIIASLVVGAEKGYLYVRAEYPLAVRRLQKSIEDLRARGILGESVMGSGRRFDLEIKEGAGAFVCGEETALLASVEGKRGIPKPRPPYPAQKGLFGCPTDINNVETYANVPGIVRNGAEWFASIGTERSKGTKVFALSGKINNTGLIEVPMGITLKEIVYGVGGGIPGGKKFKAAQTGGPSGGCITADYMDMPIDYESLKQIGTMMGSGGMVIMDEDTCMVDVARFFLSFTQHESCGKCIPCREGTKRMLEILERITAGEGKEEDLDDLERLAHVIRDTSACGLGQSAPNPVLSTLRYFRDEYEEHIRESQCRAGVCANLMSYFITHKCVGCTVCAKKCPVGAIEGNRRELHVIDTHKCIKCGLCMEVCPTHAIVRK